MLPHPISRFEPSPEDSPTGSMDLACVLEQHVKNGFPPDLALDLVLNELVVRAADATRASAAALALVRGEEMVCRAATGLHAPDLGIPLNTRDGLSGACVRTRSPQLSTDTESDPRVDPAISRRLGIRSMLSVPVFDPVSDFQSPEVTELRASHEASELDSDGANSPDGDRRSVEFSGGDLHASHLHNENGVTPIRQPQLAGVLEVFSPLPNAFSESAQALLEDFARECARIRRAAAELRARPPAEIIPLDGEVIPADAESLPAGEELSASVAKLAAEESIANNSPRATASLRQPYEGWALALGALVIAAAAAVSFMIGSRIGWLGSPQPAGASQPSPPVLVSSSPAVASAKSTPDGHKSQSPQPKPAAPAAKSTNNPPSSSSDELVVYDKGKVIFRMAPAPAAKGQPPSPDEHANAVSSAPNPTAAQVAAPVASASSLPASPAPHTVWLAPAEAESLLIRRVEPEYPADALAAHRSGNVTLEVHVAEDGTVSSVRTLTGDPFLAAAATEAVRNWRYQPYRSRDHAAPFQTDVTLTFSVPN